MLCLAAVITNWFHRFPGRQTSHIRREEPVFHRSSLRAVNTTGHGEHSPCPVRAAADRNEEAVALGPLSARAGRGAPRQGWTPPVCRHRPPLSRAADDAPSRRRRAPLIAAAPVSGVGRRRREGGTQLHPSPPHAGRLGPLAAVGLRWQHARAPLSLLRRHISDRRR